MSAAITERQNIEWRRGVALALKMLDEGSSLEDFCTLSSDGRRGRPQYNILADYLERARSHGGEQAYQAFTAVLCDFICSCANGGVPDNGLLKKLAQRRISMTLTEPTQVEIDRLEREWDAEDARA